MRMMAVGIAQMKNWLFKFTYTHTIGAVCVHAASITIRADNYTRTSKKLFVGRAGMEKARTKLNPADLNQRRASSSCQAHGPQPLPTRA